MEQSHLQIEVNPQTLTPHPSPKSSISPKNTQEKSLEQPQPQTEVNPQTLTSHPSPKISISPKKPPTPSCCLWSFSRAGNEDKFWNNNQKKTSCEQSLEQPSCSPETTDGIWEFRTTLSTTQTPNLIQKNPQGRCESCQCLEKKQKKKPSGAPSVAYVEDLNPGDLAD